MVSFTVTVITAVTVKLYGLCHKKYQYHLIRRITGLILPLILMVKDTANLVLHVRVMTISTAFTPYQKPGPKLEAEFQE